MVRVCVSVAVLVVLTSAYVTSPPAGWVGLAATFVVLLAWRSKKTGLDAAQTQTR
jgi:hypothetical protein